MASFFRSINPTSCFAVVVLLGGMLVSRLVGSSTNTRARDFGLVYREIDVEMDVGIE